MFLRGGGFEGTEGDELGGVSILNSTFLHLSLPSFRLSNALNCHRTNSFLHSLRTTLTTLSYLPIPTISAISSIALGGGLELALATTLRVFASRAIIGLPETQLGIIPGAGGTYRLRHLVGEARALELILTGRRVSGEEAFRLGICERVVETGAGEEAKSVARGEVLDAAIGMAKKICEGGPGAVGAVLRAVRGGSAEAEGRQYEGVLGFEDRDEALRAFGEKRKARFTGRRKGSGYGKVV